jgi:protein-L-isoaspartate(D-aspartate) O-methyltransferase
VRAVQGDGTNIDFDPADVIYVNAGATRPVDLWLDGLKDGGRLILALTRDKDAGACGSASSDAATGFSPNRFPRPISSRARARDAESERALVAAVEKGGWDRVTLLFRRSDLPEDQCWLNGAGLVPGLRLRSVCRLLRCARSGGPSVLFRTIMASR